MKLTQWLVRAAGALLLGVLASAARADERRHPTVPFVGCPADGQLGPLDPPKGEPMAVGIDGRSAHGLAFYRAGEGDGVLAPKGWHCRAWYGSSGAFLVVTPQEIPPPYLPPPAVDGPVVYLGTLNAETSGRFEVAVIAARLFRRSARDFIRRIRAEHILPAKDLDVGPFPADQLSYLSDRAVAFTTPAGQEGLGTRSVLMASALAVRGLVVLDASVPIQGASELRVRLPAEQADLTEEILDWERARLFNRFARPVRRR